MTDYKAPYLDARARLMALVEGTDAETFNFKPGPDAWSAAECVVHLNKTAKLYVPVFESEAAKSEPRGQQPFQYGWISRKFIDMMKPGTAPVPTLKSMKPPPAAGAFSKIDRDHAVARFNEDIDRYCAAIDAADGLDLSKIKVASPFLKLVKLPLGAFFQAMGNHTMRHIQQAERAVAARTA